MVEDVQIVMVLCPGKADDDAAVFRVLDEKRLLHGLFQKIIANVPAVIAAKDGLHAFMEHAVDVLAEGLGVAGNKAAIRDCGNAVFVIIDLEKEGILRKRDLADLSLRGIGQHNIRSILVADPIIIVAVEFGKPHVQLGKAGLDALSYVIYKVFIV